MGAALLGRPSACLGCFAVGTAFGLLGRFAVGDGLRPVGALRCLVDIQKMNQEKYRGK